MVFFLGGAVLINKKQQVQSLNTLGLFHPNLPAITILTSPAALSSSVTPGPLILATDTCFWSRVLREGKHGKIGRSSSVSTVP